MRTQGSWLSEAVDLAIDRNEVVKIFNSEVYPAETLFIEKAPGVKEAKAQGIVYKPNPDELERMQLQIRFSGWTGPQLCS